MYTTLNHLMVQLDDATDISVTLEISIVPGFVRQDGTGPQVLCGRSMMLSGAHEPPKKRVILEYSRVPLKYKS